MIHFDPCFEYPEKETSTVDQYVIILNHIQNYSEVGYCVQPPIWVIMVMISADKVSLGYIR